MLLGPVKHILYVFLFVNIIVLWLLCLYKKYVCRDPSGQCFAGMLIHFCFRKFQALAMSISLAKVMPNFFVDFGMTCARKVGHVEFPRFVEMGIKRYFDVKLLLINVDE